MSIGIIIASHEEFAAGIHQSGSMDLWGSQKVHGYVHAKWRFDDLYAKFNAVVAAFDGEDEVLVLVDLWSGSPFNQAVASWRKIQTNMIITDWTFRCWIQAYVGSLMMQMPVLIVAANHHQGSKRRCQSLPEEFDPVEEVACCCYLWPKLLFQKNGYRRWKTQDQLCPLRYTSLHGQVSNRWTPIQKPIDHYVSRFCCQRWIANWSNKAPMVKANAVPIQNWSMLQKIHVLEIPMLLILFETPQDALRAIRWCSD